ncbi:uncharacterized protein LOC142231031 [Haematobia irritans]|uniref:uncharacterized protein LOC142231031 n=1 Tax=Haematobia irritans TaxID=7368 RepID=UPI003F502E75
MTPEERFAVVKRNNLCLNCFSNNHRLHQCTSKYSCGKCNSRHNSLLHRDVRVSLSTATTDTGPNNPSTSQGLIRDTTICEQEVQNCFAKSTKLVLLGTAMVNIRANGIIFTARALLDPGSQASFISERLRRRIGLQTTRVNARISGLNNALAGSTEKQCSFILSSVGGDNFEVEVSALVLLQLTGKLPSSSISIPESFSLGDMPLADPLFGKSDQVDILIGADFYPQILLDGVQRNVLGSLVAQETIF